MRGLISLEKKALYSRSLSSRKIQVTPSTAKTNDVLLDETLKHMRSGTKGTVEEWIGLLTGESWNPLCLTYQLRQTRERLAKGLVEKGVLTSEKTDFYKGVLRKTGFFGQKHTVPLLKISIFFTENVPN